MALREPLPTIILRPMWQEDLPAVLEIERQSFGQPWSRAFFEKELATPFARLTVAVDTDAGSVVGYGAVVTGDVPPGVVVAGNPARVVRTID